MKIIQYRSLIIKLKQSEIYTVLDSCMLLTKNVYNTSLFLLHNLISSYTYDKENKTYSLKEFLYNNKTDTLKLFNQSIDKLNQQRLNKYKTKLISNNKELKEPKLLVNLTKNLSIKDFRSITLDKTLLEQVLKLKELNNKNTNKDNYIDYTKIPSIIAQYALQKAVNDISVHYKSLISYYKEKYKFTGQPKLPKYLDKNERLTLDIHHSYFKKSGALFKINSKKHTLYSNFYKQQESIINGKDIDFFNQFNFKEALLTEIEKRLNKSTKNKFLNKENKVKYNLQTIRLVPQRVSNKGKNKYPLKIEVIIEVEQKITDNAPIALLINYYNKNKLKYKFTTLQYHELKDSIKEKVILDFINDNSNQLTYLAGGDLGQNNLFALALSKGKNQIYPGNKVNHYLTKLNIKLDQVKSTIFENSLSKELYDKIKYNQKITEQNKDIFKYNELHNLSEEQKIEKLDKLALNLEDLKSIKEANSKIYSNIKYNKILVEMDNYKNNILHKLSNNIIQHCLKNKIQCLVVGKNEHWKQEINLSKKTNRLFMSIPHGKLIELLKYKCFAKGLLFITTEESYTSKSSFLHNDPLPIYNKIMEKKELNKNQQSHMEEENNHSHNNEINNKSGKKSKINFLYNFSGIRNHHEYKLNQPIEKIINFSKKKFDKEVIKYNSIHADINGAFNMLRKIFKNFQYDNIISIKYESNDIMTERYYNKNKLNRALVRSSS